MNNTDLAIWSAKTIADLQKQLEEAEKRYQALYREMIALKAEKKNQRQEHAAA